MPLSTQSIYCPNCKANRAHQKNACAHLVHALVTLFLCGLWIPVWIIAAIAAEMRSYRCTQCGAAAKKGGSLTTFALAGVGAVIFVGGILTVPAMVITYLKRGAPTTSSESLSDIDPTAPATTTEIDPAPGSIDSGGTTPDEPTVSPFPTAPRTWTAKDGRTMQAAAIDYDPGTGKVEFQRADGKFFDYDVNNLSPADQEILDDLALKATMGSR